MISFPTESSILWPCARFLQNGVLESLTGKRGRKAIYFQAARRENVKQAEIEKTSTRCQLVIHIPSMIRLIFCFKNKGSLSWPTPYILSILCISYFVSTVSHNLFFIPSLFPLQCSYLQVDVPRLSYDYLNDFSPH